MRRDLPRVHRPIEHAFDLLDDGHLDAGLAGQLQHRRHRGEAFGGLFHLLDHVLEAVALPEQATGGVVAAEGRLAGRDEVAEPGQSLKGLGLGPLGDGEIGHLDQAPRDDRGLGVLAVTDPVDDADRDGDEVFEHPAELGADDVGVHEAAEVAVA